MTKYSYSKSSFSDSNTELFGNTILQRSLKDYNGQTYWLSVNINSFFELEKNSFPKWLNFALGYSGNGMISAQNKTGDNRYRQYLFSLDIDLTRIETKNKLLKKITHLFSFVKIPFPSFEFSNNQLKLHSIYF